MITYLQAIILGLFQGVTELFPVSSLGHSVLLSSLFGWHNLLQDQVSTESNFLLFLVAVHVATALALLIFYRQQWYRIIKGFFASLKARKITDADSRMAWLLIAATIPAGLIGLIFEHSLRTQFAKPLSATIFIILNGLLLLAGDRYIENHRPRQRGGSSGGFRTSEQSVVATGQSITLARSAVIGTAQIGALFAGISRSGITMISGIYSGLNREDAARFSFLLATPIILGAGVYKLPSVFSAQTAGMRGQMLVGALLAGVAAYFSVRYLDKYFQNKRLRPFGLYSIGFGVFMLLMQLVRGQL